MQCNPSTFPFAAFCFTLIDQLHTEKGDLLVKKKLMLFQKNVILTIETFMSGNKGTPQFMTRFIDEILKVLFTLLAKFVLHFLGTTRSSLRTYSKVLTCNTDRKQCFHIVPVVPVLYLYQTLYVKVS